MSSSPTDDPPRRSKDLGPVLSNPPLPGSHGPVADFALQYRTSISACGASIISTVVGFPLDTVKTRMQTYKYDSVWDCFAKTRKTEGINGFFRGVAVPLFSVTIVRTISFSTYEKCKNFYATLLRPISASSAAIPDMSPVERTFVYGLSGMTAGAATTFIACPFELTKLSTQIEKLMAQSRLTATSGTASPGSTSPVAGSITTETLKPKGSIQSARDIVRARGFMGLYSGFKYHLARDAIGTGLYFTVYETVKGALTKAGGEATTLTYAISGGLCGALSWCLVFPVDTIKSVRQRDALREAFGGEVGKTPLKFNLRRMYRGVSASMFRSCIVTAINFTVYEELKKMIGVGAPEEEDESA
ncbi:mitochondrial carrier [Saitoella complicata NRRL Y-17804]|nr:mitochondrial carrier [Saitoella complicata NRRL Y-17804]ODQ54224.1 mitochondrial carrier [Saitoella complicata NRRL Y-17804]